MSKKELTQLMNEFAVEIAEQVIQKPLWKKESKENSKKLRILAEELNRPPFDTQAKVILPLAESLNKYKVAILIAEMGTGKTQMSFSTAYLRVKSKKNRKILFLSAGAKHIENMKKEAVEIYGDRAVVKTIVNKNNFEKIGKKEITPEAVYSEVVPEGKVYIYVLSKDTAKMTVKELPVYNWNDRCPECNERILTKSQKAKLKAKKEIKTKILPLNCPECNANLTSKVAKNLKMHARDENGEPIVSKASYSYKLDEEGNGFLDEAGAPVMEEKIELGLFPKRLEKQCSSGMRKTSVGEKFKRLQRNSKDKIFGMLIVDEAHEMQSGESLQGKAYRELVSITEEALIMTGTLSNGYASSVFYILQGLMPKYFKEIGYKFSDVSKFVDHFGTKKSETTIIKSMGSKTTTKVSELPKISDRIISLLAPFTCWVKMEDLNLVMPSYSESSRIVPANPELLGRLNSYREEVISALKKYNPRLVKSFASKFMYMQNNPTHEFTYDFVGKVPKEVPCEFSESGLKVIYDEKDFSFPFESFPKIDSETGEGMIFSKEQALINDVIAHKKRGRKMLIYSIYNKAAGIAGRLDAVLKAKIPGLTVNVMPDSVGGTGILPWIEANDDADVVICSPKKVATGYNLVQFSTFMFYESGINLREAQQAARRGWRAVGQTQEVEVVFYAYEGIQAHILEIMSKKMRAAATIDGKKVEEGQLAEEFDDDKDMTEALNSIADKIERKYKADFSASNSSGGAQRAKTELEQEYCNILEEVKAKKAEKAKIEVPSVQEIVKADELPKTAANIPLELPVSKKETPVKEIIKEDKKVVTAALLVSDEPKIKVSKKRSAKKVEQEVKIDNKGQMSFVF